MTGEELTLARAAAIAAGIFVGSFAATVGVLALADLAVRAVRREWARIGSG